MATTNPSSPVQGVANLEVPTAKERGRKVSRLLNPMSLLSRHRTSHPVIKVSNTSIPQNSPPSITIKADPSIRGTKVHDFDSAPRPRRNISSSDVHLSDEKSDARLLTSPEFQCFDYADKAEKVETSLWTGKEHVPVFTEDFEEEQYPAAGLHVRKTNDLSDLPLPNPPFAPPTRLQNNHPPVIAQNKIDHIADGKTGVESCRKQSSMTSLELNGDLLTMTAFTRTFPVAEPKIMSTCTTSPPRTSPASIKTRSRTVSGASTREFLINGVKPRHMKSTSSRFSFDMLGAANQEKVLEERHRQKALVRQQSVLADYNDDKEFEDFDYDCILDDIGVEEDIPIIGEDDSEYDCYAVNEEIPMIGDDTIEDKTRSLVSWKNQRMPDSNVAIGIPIRVEDCNPATTKDGSAAVDDFATSIGSNSKWSGNHDPRAAVISKNDDEKTNALTTSHQLPSVGARCSLTIASKPPVSSPSELAWPESALAGLGLGLQGVTTDHGDDDDMYFDDGTFDQVEEFGESVEFDESMFDNNDTDQYGRPVCNLSQRPLYLVSSRTEDCVSSSNHTTSIRDNRNLDNLRLSTESAKAVKFETTGSIHKSSLDRNSLIFQQPTLELTRDTLSAYQSALAAAAQNAADNGRFDRSASICHNLGDLNTQTECDLPTYSGPNDLLQSQDFLQRMDEYDVEVDGFDYDDAMDDDAIIAEANAEALANDSDGFYGQEFGFYSNPIYPNKQVNETVSEPSFGGFFGPRSADGLLRSKSGKILREPNLTPITERSEFSNRNSLMSLPASSTGWNMSSPGLAQLATMDQWDDNDMSLSALMRMRRGAWAGSQASVRSSNGDGSPLVVVGEELSPSNDSLWSPSIRPGLGNKRRTSATSIGHSETSSAPASPTLSLINMTKQMQIANGISKAVPEFLKRTSFTASSLSVSSSAQAASIGTGRPQTPQRNINHRHTSSVESVL